MQRSAAPNGRAKYLILALPLFFIFAYVGTRYYSSPLPVPARRPVGSSHGPSDWWIEFFTRLHETRVTARPTKIEGKARGDNWKPDIDYARPELLELNEADKAKFRDSHASFVKQLPEFANRLPYHGSTTGIVTTAGAPNFGQAISLVLMARQAGSRLPIQIVLDSSAPWVDSICANTMPRYNATCVFLEEKWAKLHPPAVKFQRFQWKFVSIIASTFQNVLFLDADCLPVLNPDPIFAKGAEPFTSAGFIAWPDFWTQSASPLFYKIAGDLEVPPLTSRTTSESGVMVYDKARHADTLLLAAYYNYNGPDHYYAMLTQHGPGEGDKETFFQAALVLAGLREKGVYEDPTGWMKPGVEVKKGYWDIKKLPSVHGRTAKGKQWRGMFMQQMDPMEDYRVVTAAVEKAKAEDKPDSESSDPSRKDGGPARQRRRELGPPFADRSHPRSPRPVPEEQQQGGAGDAAAPPKGPPAVNPRVYLTNSTFLAHVGNLTTEPHNHGRYMFFHHNGVKPDFTRILDPESGILAVDDADRPIRMWGDPGWIVERTGRDVEKLLWQESIDVYCQPPPRPGGLEWEKVCAEMKKIWDAVYL